MTRSSACAIAAFAPLVIAAVAACSGAGKSMNQPANDPAANNGATEDCPLPSDGDAGLPEYATFAAGSSTGTSVSASFCNAGVNLMSTTGGSPPNAYLSIDSTALGASSEVKLPSGAVSGTLNVSITLPSPTAGVYTSATAGQCGSVIFSYGTLLESVATCNAGANRTSYSCPNGCTYGYVCADASDYFCCIPEAETFVYAAQTATSCVTNGNTTTPPPQPVLGSWTLTLTSVTLFTGDAGWYSGYQTYYLAHGTFTATVAGTTDTGGTATVSLTF